MSHFVRNGWRHPQRECGVLAELPSTRSRTFSRVGPRRNAPGPEHSQYAGHTRARLSNYTWTPPPVTTNRDAPAALVQLWPLTTSGLALTAPVMPPVITSMLPIPRNVKLAPVLVVPEPLESPQKPETPPLAERVPRLGAQTPVFKLKLKLADLAVLPGSGY